MPNSDSVENLKIFIEGEFKLINNKLDNHIKIVNEHHSDLYGEDLDSPGIKLKVDRLEQSKKNSEKHLGVVYATAIGLIIKSIFDYFTKK